MNMAAARTWVVVNPSVQNALGHHTSYILVPGVNSIPYVAPASQVRRRAGFINHHFWATRYNADEMYAAGAYPNQSLGGDGLPQWVANNESLVQSGRRRLVHDGRHAHSAAGGVARDAGHARRIQDDSWRVLLAQSGARRAEVSSFNHASSAGEHVCSELGGLALQPPRDPFGPQKSASTRGSSRSRTSPPRQRIREASDAIRSPSQFCKSDRSPGCRADRCNARGGIRAHDSRDRA